MSERTLNEAARTLLAEAVIANLATVDANGTPVWVDVDGDDVVINTADGRKKIRTMRRSAKVAVSVVDPQDPYRVVALQGTVTDTTDHGADDTSTGSPVSTSTSGPTRCASPASAASSSPSGLTGSSYNPPTADLPPHTKTWRFHHE